MSKVQKDKAEPSVWLDYEEVPLVPEDDFKRTYYTTTETGHTFAYKVIKKRESEEFCCNIL